MLIPMLTCAATIDDAITPKAQLPSRPVKSHRAHSRSAIRTVGVSPCEGIRCAIPARVAEGRHRNSTLSGKSIALHHCWASCPRDPSVPPGEKHPFGSFSARQRRIVLDSTPLLVPAMSRTRGTYSAVRCGRPWVSRLRSWGHPLRCPWRKPGRYWWGTAVSKPRWTSIEAAHQLPQGTLFDTYWRPPMSV
jgi:hypothetical protein